MINDLLKLFKFEEQPVVPRPKIHHSMKVKCNREFPNEPNKHASNKQKKPWNHVIKTSKSVIF